jgi:predicted transcriptional regulator
MFTNTKEIKKRLIDLDITQSECAKRMQMSLTTFNFKLNGKAEWSVSEIDRFRKILKISKLKMIEYFFCTQG